MSGLNIGGAAPPVVIRDSSDLLALGGAKQGVTIRSSNVLPSSPDERVKISAADTTTGMLDTKIVAGSGISLAILNPGANEQLEITSTAATETLQATYDASTPAVATLSGANGAVRWRDNATPLGGTLWAVQDNAGASDYLAISATAVTAGVPVGVPFGSASDPGLYFGTDTDTGFIRSGVNSVSSVTGGVERWRTNASGHMVAQGDYDLRSGDGSAGTPSLSFVNANNRGLYVHPSGGIGFAMNGISRWQFANSGDWNAEGNYAVKHGDGAANDPSVGFANASATVGLYLNGTGLGFAAAGAEQWTLDATGNWVDPTGANLVDGVDVSAHAARHENGGADEISVLGLSGLLADAQTPLAHAASHLPSGGDPLTTAVAVSIGGGNAEGTAESFARSDHTHALVETGGPTTLTIAGIADTFLVRRNGTTLEGIDPASVGVTDHGALTGLSDDDHSQYPLGIGRSGGQTIYGSPTTAETLTLGGSSGANVGFINLNSPVIFGPYASNPSATYGFSYAETESFTSPFIGGGLNFSGNITFTNGTFIYESFRGAPNITTAVNPGFAAYTVLQALPRFNAGSGAGHNPLAPLILNAGPSLYHDFTGTRTVLNVAAVNFAPQVRTTSTGTLNVTSTTGITVSPKWSTSSGSTISFGTVRGVWMQNPTVAPFGGTSAGTETMTAYVGLEVDAIASLGGTPVVAAVRSAITSATNRYFLLNNGGALSEMSAGNIHFDDGAGVQLGSPANGDVALSWQAAGYYQTTFASTFDSLRWSSPSADRFLFDTNGGNTAAEYNFNCFKFSMGAQTGSNGNQIGNFVAGTRSTTLAGEWSDFLLTQAANITVDHAMGLVAGWTVNAPSITIGTGSVTTAAGLNIGGNMGGAGFTNKAGLRILSNPSGASGVNAALWVTAGNTQLDGDFTHTGTNWGIFGATPTTQPAAYTRNATVVEDRTLLASASATVLNNNNVLAALIADLQSLGIIG